MSKSKIMTNIEAKLVRALQHLQTIEQLAAPILKKKYSFRTHYDTTSSEVLVICNSEVDIPIELSIISGEVVHQLRSSLDHLIWAMVENQGNTPSRNNQFPIFRTHDEYLSKSGRMVEGISPSAKAIIESVQPFSSPPPDGPEYHPLLILSGLNNADKHRSLNVISAIAYAGSESIHMKGSFVGGIRISGLGDYRPIKKGEILLRVKTLDPKMQVNTQLSTAIIAFDEITNLKLLPVIKVLDILIDSVAWIADSLQSELA